MPDPSPYKDTAPEFREPLGEFYSLLNREDGPPTAVRLAVGQLLNATIYTAPAHLEKTIDRLSDLHFDSEGILADEHDDNVYLKAQLHARVMGMLVASEFSRLTNDQRDQLLGTAQAYAKKLKPHGKRALSNSLLRYIAHDAEWALNGDPATPLRRQRGKFVLNIGFRHGLIPAQESMLYARALRRLDDPIIIDQ